MNTQEKIVKNKLGLLNLAKTINTEHDLSCFSVSDIPQLSDEA